MEQREQVLAAALRVFIQVGFHAATTRAIADEAGVTSPAIYRHFSAKTEIYLAVLHHVGDEFVTLINNAVSGQRMRETAVAAAVHACFEFLVDDGPANLLLNADGRNSPEVRQAVDTIWRSVTDIILRAATRGKVISQGDLAAMRVFLAGALGSTPQLRSADGLALDRSSAERLMTDMVWSCIRGLGGVDQAALIELDEGDARARDGLRHLIQHMVPAEPQTFHAVPVSIYLEAGSGAVEVESAVRTVLDDNGMVVVETRNPVIGSWFRLLLGRTKKALTSEQMADLASRLERAIELQVLHKPQAEINSAELDGVAKLITALGQEQNACIQIGSVFLLKVDGNIVSRNVSQREMAFLERNSGLLGTPREVLAALERAARSVATADKVSIEDGAVRLSMQQPDDRGCIGLTVSVGDHMPTVYEVGFDAVNGSVPVSSGVTHVQAHHDTAVIRADGVTITVRRVSDPAKQFQLVVASETGRTTSYELDFTRSRGR